MGTVTRDSKGILCSGSIVFDILARPAEDSSWGTTSFIESIEYHLGGNGANTALALAIIGMPVRLVASVGSDEQARFALDKLAGAGVDISAVTVFDAPTASSIVLVNGVGDRKFFHRLGANENAFAEPVQFTPALIEGISHYHLASLFVLPRLRAHAPEMLREARSAGLSTSVDVNWDPEARWMKDLEPCLPHVDILFMNEDEARMVTGSSDPAVAAKMVLRKGAGTAVMKLGSRGCAIYTGDGEIVCPGFDVDVLDTTGAGDCFAAGYLAALSRGATWPEAGAYANAVAAQSVQKIGAVAGLRSHSETETWIRSARLRRI